MAKSKKQQHVREVAQAEVPEVAASIPGARLDDINRESPRRESWWHWKPTSDKQAEKLEAQMLAPVRALFPNFEQQMVDVGEGVKINTIKVGSGPPLVMLHGMAAGLGFWTHNLPVLAKKHTVYCIDMPGFGRSSRVPFRKSCGGREALVEGAENYFLAPIDRWATAMGLERFALLGHSFGGYLSGAYALKHPERVRHLIFADPWGIPDRDTGSERRRQLPMKWRMVVGVMQNFNPLAALRLAGPWGPDLIGRFRGDIPEKFRSVYKDPRIVLDYIYHINVNEPTGESAFTTLCEDFGWSKAPLQTRLLNLDPKIPVTLVYGKESWMSRKAGKAVRKSLAPRAEYFSIEWAGHHIYADNFNRFNDILIDELERWKGGVTAQAVNHFGGARPGSDTE